MKTAPEFERGVENSSEKEARAILVGRLIRSYRADRVHKGKRLTQAGLAELMSEISPYYDGFDHANISRWENGRALPTRAALIIAMRAMRLPDSEMDGILELAGHEKLYREMHPDSSWMRDERRYIPRDSAWGPLRGAKSFADSAFLRAALASFALRRAASALRRAAFSKAALSRAAAPAVYAAAVGLALNALGVNGTLALIAYAAVALGIVIGRGVFLALRRRSAEAASELFFAMMFFILNAPPLMFAVTRTDHFGFYALIPWDDGSSHFLTLALAAHLALAFAASTIFDALRARLAPSQGRVSGFGMSGRELTYPRKALLIGAFGSSLPPCLFALVVTLALADESARVFYAIALPASVVAFTAILTLQDNRSKVWRRGMRVSLATALAAIILLCAALPAITATAYFSPSPASPPDRSLFIAWETDYERLGYPPEEFAGRHRAGSLLMSVSVAAYLAAALVVILLLAARRRLLLKRTRG